MAACSSSPFLSDDVNDEGSNDNNGNTDSGSSATTYASSLADLTSFDIAIDKTALEESETVPADDEDYIENNTFKNEVAIVFNGSTATVSGDVSGVTVTKSAADVTINSTAKKVVYTVSGSTSDGFLKIYSDNKYQLVLNGVSITNPNGAPINLQKIGRAHV